METVLLLWEHPRNTNLAEAHHWAEDAHDTSDSCQFHHKPRSQAICLPNAYPWPPRPNINTHLWAWASFSHMYMVPIRLSSKYYLIYVCKPWQTHSSYFHLTQSDLNQQEFRPILVFFLKYLTTLSNPPRIFKDLRQNKTRQPGSLGPAPSWTKETFFLHNHPDTSHVFPISILAHQTGHQCCVFLCLLTFSADSSTQSYWEWLALRFLLNKTYSSHACRWPFCFSWC